MQVAALAWLACEALCCLVRSAGHITERYCRRPVAHPPRLQSEISGSCSPLEGDVGPRADELQPDPQGSGFSLGQQACRVQCRAPDRRATMRASEAGFLSCDDSCDIPGNDSFGARFLGTIPGEDRMSNRLLPRPGPLLAAVAVLIAAPAAAQLGGGPPNPEIGARMRGVPQPPFPAAVDKLP